MTGFILMPAPGARVSSLQCILTMQQGQLGTAAQSCESQHMHSKL